MGVPQGCKNSPLDYAGESSRLSQASFLHINDTVSSLESSEILPYVDNMVLFYGHKDPIIL